MTTEEELKMQKEMLSYWQKERDRLNNSLNLVENYCTKAEQHIKILETIPKEKPKGNLSVTYHPYPPPDPCR